VNGINSWSHMLLAFAGLGLVTILTRGSFFMVPSTVQLPPRVERALRYAPACALTAIIAPDIFTRDNRLFLTWHNYELLAVVVAIAVFLKTRNMLTMMAVGMLAFTLFDSDGTTTLATGAPVADAGPNHTCVAQDVTFPHTGQFSLSVVAAANIMPAGDFYLRFY